MTAKLIGDTTDVVGFLKAQHEQIKAMLIQVETATVDDRETAFVQLRRLLAVHETAEEEIVHPRARRELEGGERIVDARLAEEHEGKETLAALEKLDVNSNEFAEKFAAFKFAVLSHAEAEERDEFGKLAGVLEDEQLERMRNAVRIAEHLAPTRPHPGVESPLANALVGPFAAMLDRARDLIRG